MSKLAKIAIGCAVAAGVAGIVVVAAVMGGAWWLRGKAEGYLGQEKKIEELKKKADAVPFSAPADGVVAEARLVKFLEIRKRVYAIYEQHKPELEAMGRKQKGELGDAMKAFSWINEIRKVQAEAQAELGMGEAEYRFLVEAVYKSAWASEIAKQTGGKSASEALEEAGQKGAEAMAQAREQAKDLPPEQQKALEEAAEQMRESAAASKAQMKALDVPKQNVELFRKYEADIKKYGMSGLEWIGL